MSKIIISADDFGRSLSRNRAIDYCFRHGLITSAALLVNSKYTTDAIDMAIDGGYLDRLHCHFNFSPGEVSGFSKPLSVQYKDCSLLSENGDFISLHHFSPLKCSNKLFRIVENEMECQYSLFKELTKSKGCFSHIDFHLYSNLLWPVAGALKLFSEEHGISSVRYIGGRRLHSNSLLSTLKKSIILYISKAKQVKSFPSYQADQFIQSQTNNEILETDFIEVYVHPDSANGLIVDNTKSYDGRKIITMEETFNLIAKDIKDFVPWSVTG
jgi:predicted glycoside hydrolase/deacetylase ChbG (UPF0249 family)